MTASVAYPPEGLSAPDEPPHAPPPPTRPPMPFWNRIRLLLLFAIAWLILVWAAMADNPLLPFVDSVRIQLHESQWLIWLAGLELLRQLHYLIEERSARYYRFWSQKVFGAADRAVRKRMSDWTRFRLARMVKVALIDRAGGGRRGQGAGHVAGAGDLPGAGAALPGAADDPAAGVRVLLHRVPVHRPVLAAVPGRR